MRTRFQYLLLAAALVTSTTLRADSLADVFVVDGVRLAVARTHVVDNYASAAAQIEAGFHPQTRSKLAGALVLGRQVGSLHQTLTLRPSAIGTGTDITAASQNLQQATTARVSPQFNLYPGASVLRTIEFDDRTTHVSQWVGHCRCSAEQVVRRFSQSTGTRRTAGVVTAAQTSKAGALVAISESPGQVTTLVARALPRGSLWVAVQQTQQREVLR